MTNHPNFPCSAIGFGQMDAAPALPADRPFAAERIEIHVLYCAPATAEAGTAASLWAVLDFMDFDLSVVEALKNGITLATGIGHGHIHILSTHNHGGGTPDVAVLANLTGQAAVAAMRAARPAEIRAAALTMPPGINYRRRITVPEFQSMWSCFAGPNMFAHRSAAGFIENAQQAMAHGELVHIGWQPSSRPAPDFQPGDPVFFVMEFREADTRRPLGTLTRFAMHAVMRNSEHYYSSDYPWHIRREFAQSLGGAAIFMNGPCADLAPCYPWPEKNAGHAARHAGQLAQAGLAELENHPWTPLTIATAASRQVALPVRAEVLANVVELDGPMPPATDLPARKRWLERERLSTTLSFLEDKYRNGEKQLTPTVSVELGKLCLNEWTILAYPGETFSTTAAAVAAACPEQQLISVTEHGRTVMYMPPEFEYLQGGYESICAVTSPRAEAILRAAAIEFAARKLSWQTNTRI